MIATLIESRSITPRDTLYVLQNPELAKRSRPGQFVEIKLTDAGDPFLRRPISIFDCDGENTISLLVRTVGYGTQHMTQWQPGMQVDVLGPLGNGFTLDPDASTCLLIGGGIGLAPLNFLARTLLHQGKKVHILFSPKRDAQLVDALSDADSFTIHYADNRAHFSTVLSALLQDMPDQVFACGPEGLLEIIADQTAELGIPCQLSMERRMGCGFGICLGCAISIRTENGLVYKKVCKDGPVFRAEEVSFHELP